MRTQADSQHGGDPVEVVVLVLERHHDRVLVVLADKVMRIAVAAPLGLDLEVGQLVALLVTSGAGHVRHGFLHHERVGGRNVGGLALVDGLDQDARQVQFVAFVVGVHGCLVLGGGGCYPMILKACRVDGGQFNSMYFILSIQSNITYIGLKVKFKIKF